ncbi:TIGR04222 domain-containing membrane protein [Plantactinospora sp. WMMB334]|uniref:TIGR04222 domain-containing membrane protein n=1 Tax=Plantactinospora sp. WMMB334 TaxID=3404119 RepID=UPI003B943576
MAAHRDLSATDLGYLSGGSWGAVRTGLVLLHGRGGVVVDRPGGLHRAGPVPVRAEPLERALFGALYGSMAPREVANQRRVRQTLAAQRESLIGLGLLRPAWRRFLLPAVLVLALPMVIARLVAADLLGVQVGLVVVLAFVGIAGWFLPRRTLAGDRLLRAARREHPLPVAPSGARGTPPAGGGSARDPGLMVALYGQDGLRTVLPAQFARDSGLLGGGCRLLFLGDSRLDGPPVAGAGEVGGGLP